MPDWDRIVGERLGRTKLPPEEHGEVVEELAAHLEDCYDELCEVGSPDPEGYTLAQVPDWQFLGRKIRQAKEDSMYQIARVFVCGLTAGTVSAFALVALIVFGGEFYGVVEAARGRIPAWIPSLGHLASGIWIIWLYAAIRPKYGPGPKTALAAAFALWIIGFLASAGWASLGPISFNVFLIVAGVSLPSWMAGVVAGAWCFDALERRPSSPTVEAA